MRHQPAPPSPTQLAPCPLALAALGAVRPLRPRGAKLDNPTVVSSELAGEALDRTRHRGSGLGAASSRRFVPRGKPARDNRGHIAARGNVAERRGRVNASLALASPTLVSVA